MKNLLSEELMEERILEKYREDIEGGFQVLAGKEQFCRVAAEAYISLADVWGLTQTQAAHFLGIEENEYQRWIDEEYDRIASDQLEKISCLLGIYRHLKTLYSGQQHRGERWLKSENVEQPYGGSSPLDLLSGSEVSIFRLVRKELAAKTV